MTGALPRLLQSVTTTSARLDVPVDPSADEARRLLREELSKQEYQAERPTWFDLFATWVRDRIENAFGAGPGGGPPGAAFGIILVIIIAALVIAFLVFGLPRLNRRSKVSGVLFGEDDDRDSAAIRQSAAAAANAGDYTFAVAEAFRALARGLAERTILTVTPGSTARDFSARAGVPFPALAAAFTDAAANFDDVRYLGREGTRAQFEQVSTLEKTVRGTRPVLEHAAPESAEVSS
jgi:hypothetical protein